jgi:AraC-like DNA-binding protein
MVCPRCIATVQDVFAGLNLNINSVQLGEVVTSVPVTTAQKEELEQQLSAHGFELLQDNNSKLIGQIKSLIIDQIHYQPNSLNLNFSTWLAEQMNHEYTSLSKLFSSVEGMTIERFILKQKMEKVKELLFYNQLSLKEIAFQLGYSSTAHLSAQFKKETGMTPTSFKKMRKPGHRSLDSL